MWLIVSIGFICEAWASAPEGLSDWEVLQEGDIWVGCAHFEGATCCGAKGAVEAPRPPVVAGLDAFYN